MILDEILARTRADLVDRKQRLSYEDLAARANALPSPHSLAEALRQGSAGGKVAVIAEHKRRSPSKGTIRDDLDPAAVARAYAAGGASALSVLTDGPFFGGSLGDLGAARAAVSLPILRKDFIVDPYQVVEARAAGADAVLLIMAALPPSRLEQLLGACASWNLEALVECHDEKEVERAVSAGAKIIGINQRDLRTFEVDRGLAARLRPRIPQNRVAVCESGISSPDDIKAAAAAGLHAVLVGEALMRAPEPGTALRELLA